MKNQARTQTTAGMPKGKQVTPVPVNSKSVNLNAKNTNKK